MKAVITISFTVAIEDVGVDGCRITPNVFTSENEIDPFSQAMLELASTT